MPANNTFTKFCLITRVFCEKALLNKELLNRFILLLYQIATKYTYSASTEARMVPTQCRIAGLNRSVYDADLVEPGVTFAADDQGSTLPGARPIVNEDRVNFVTVSGSYLSTFSVIIFYERSSALEQCTP